MSSALAIPRARKTSARQRSRDDPGLIPLHLYGLRRRTVNLVTLGCGVFAIFTLIPIWWIFVSATKTAPNMESTFGFWFAGPFHLFSNVKELFSYDEGGSFPLWVRNTAIYAAAGGTGATVLSAMAGYGFARFNFRGRNALFLFVVAALLIPITAFAVPLYLVYAKVHLDSTMPGIFIPFMISPTSVYLMRVYVGGSVPKELMDAARVDGAREATIFLRVAVPLMVPALATVFMLNVVGAWNNYFLPFIVNNNANLNTLTQGLPIWMDHANIAGGNEDYLALAVTGGLLSIVPLLLMFTVLQRHWRGGLLLGGLTG
ncbi:MAG TPA: carbohydrate ABC transporter permease [Acidimicrobiales bacterium]|nr:carbohydrate ABC transporter permease [Acidimicrobiales bacterium]